MTGSKHGVTILPATAREVLTEPARVAEAFVALMLRELK